MHPLSTAIILLGTAIALPIAAKFRAVASNGNRLAFVGHQTGVLISLGGWLLTGRIWIGVAYAAWFTIAQAWYSWSERSQRRSTS